MIDEERIRARIAVLQAELEAFVRDANARIMAYQFGIKELTDLVTPPTDIAS